jgi:succinyl-CoA synthetase beta subunit
VDGKELSFPTVLKAQVPVGGRGKAGGVQIARSQQEASDIIKRLLGSSIRGHVVRALLAEEMTEILNEYYVAILLDKSTNRPMIMACREGGIDIETVARKAPAKIVRCSLDFSLGLPQFTVRRLSKALGIRDTAAFGRILQSMYELLVSQDISLVEINPLAEVPGGLIALDAKIILDDKAAFRHQGLHCRLEEEQRLLDGRCLTTSERLAAERGITYVPMDGDVGLISDGAGTGMLALDLVQGAGGRAANFCELGGLADADIMCQAIDVVLANPQIRSLLISLIGGLTRMDEMAHGIVNYANKDALVPMVVRMCGTQERAGKEILERAGIATYEDLPQAIQQAVELARKG